MTHSPLLLATSLTKSFGGVQALAGIDWSITAGEICGVVGPNGSGKTTFFHCLTGYHEPTAGTVLWQGRDITRLSMHQRARLGLARTFQHAEVFSSLTAVDNLQIALRRRTTRGSADLPATTDELLDVMRLTDVAHKAAGSLAYGHKRLLGIGMAVALRPALLLLDEPTSGLNESESEEIHHRLAELRSFGLAIGIIDHHMEFLLPLCDRMYVLSTGERLWEGPPEEFRRNEKVVEAYLGRGTESARPTPASEGVRR